MADINTLWNTLTNWSFKDLIKASRLNAGQDNIKQLKDYIRGDNGEGTGVDGHTHNGINSLITAGSLVYFNYSQSQYYESITNGTPWLNFDSGYNIGKHNANNFFGILIEVFLNGGTITSNAHFRIAISDGINYSYSNIQPSFSASEVNTNKIYNFEYNKIFIVDLSTLDLAQDLILYWQYKFDDDVFGVTIGVNHTFYFLI